MINHAYAQAAGQQPSMLASFIPLILIFLIFYFLLIRPQQKKQKEHKILLDSIKRGDEVLTSGGAPAAKLGVGLIREFAELGLRVVAGGGVRKEDVVALGEAGVEAIHASCRKENLLDLEGTSGEIFDLKTNPVDYSKVEALADAIGNWNNF